MIRLEGAWSSRGEDLLGGRETVGQGELEVLGQELLDVGATDVGGLLNLDDLEDLHNEFR